MLDKLFFTVSVRYHSLGNSNVSYGDMVNCLFHGTNLKASLNSIQQPDCQMALETMLKKKEKEWDSYLGSAIL